MIKNVQFNNEVMIFYYINNMYRIKLNRMHSIEERIQILIERSEIMSVLSSKASVFWFK